LTIASFIGINFESRLEKSFPIVTPGHGKPGEGRIDIPAMETTLDFRKDLLLMGMAVRVHR